MQLDIFILSIRAYCICALCTKGERSKCSKAWGRSLDVEKQNRVEGPWFFHVGGKKQVFG